jgi:hypothetical protein
VNVIDGIDDHRRDAADRLAHHVSLAVAIVYFGQAPVTPFGLAVWADALPLA